MSPARRRAERATARALSRFGTLAGWRDAPQAERALPLLPPAIPEHPVVAYGAGASADLDPDGLAHLIQSVREHRLFWPASRANAKRPVALVDALGATPTQATALTIAARREVQGEVAVLTTDGDARIGDAGWSVPDLSWVGLDRLEVVYGPADSNVVNWAALGGIRATTPDGFPDPQLWAARARFVEPWSGKDINVDEGVGILMMLRGAAQRNDRRVVTVAFSRWKRRNVTSFLAGPAGPARHLRKSAARRFDLGDDERFAVWGADEPSPSPRDAPLRIEDGFVRSVGLGLRHAPPASVVVDDQGLYFDATKVTDFEAIARDAEYSPALAVRAARLRQRLCEERITKYNLATASDLPETDRTRVLVPGQVEGDASLRFGAPGAKTNAELVKAARRRRPDAFILYKPHPDVVSGLRRGALDAEAIDCADAIVSDASAVDCLDWAQEVETLTSLMGFEALLRSKKVATHGRPFFAGWGLTEIVGEPFERGRELTVDELVAAALILYPRYIHPPTGLPATPERVLDWLAEERAFARTPAGRLRGAWRGAVSYLLNVVG